MVRGLLVADWSAWFGELRKNSGLGRRVGRSFVTKIHTPIDCFCDYTEDGVSGVKEV